jgi:hypothetical protein
MMNVTIISPTENSLTKRGNRHPFLTDLLLKSGYNVEYISSNFYHAYKRSFSKKEISNAQKKGKHNQVFLSVPGYKSNFSLLRVITHQIFSIKVFLYLISHPSPDLVIFPSRPPELIFSITVAKFLKKYKTIIDVSDIWPDYFFPNRYIIYVLFSMYCNFFQYLSIPFHKNFVYTTPIFLKWIYRYQKKCTPRFISLGYDKERWTKNSPLKKIGEEKKFVYIGNIAQIINLVPLINGLKEFKDWSLTIIGGGDGLEDTKKYIKDNNIKNVFFYGFVNKNVIPDLIKQFHISVIPIEKAGLPNKMFDSIGSYRPILAFGNNDATNFVINNDVGWALEFDEKKVVDFLNHIEDSDIIKKSENIMKIKELYSKEYLYNQFVEYVNELLH